MASSLFQFDIRRIRTYLFRIPLCTRLLLGVIVIFWIAGTVLPWFRSWAALTPNEVGLGTSQWISYTRNILCNESNV